MNIPIKDVLNIVVDLDDRYGSVDVKDFIVNLFSKIPCEDLNYILSCEGFVEINQLEATQDELEAAQDEIQYLEVEVEKIKGELEAAQVAYELKKEG